MIFAGRNATDNVMHATRIESVLNQVARAIVTKGAEDNFPFESHANIRPKIKIDHHNAREKHSLKLAKQDTQTDSLPTYTNYWLAQSDPNYVSQEENDTDFPRRRRRGGGPEQGVQDYQGNWMSAGDLRRALQERFPNTFAERTMGGGPQTMGAPDYPFSNTGVVFADSSATSRRRKKPQKAHWPREII